MSLFLYIIGDNCMRYKVLQMPVKPWIVLAAKF